MLPDPLLGRVVEGKYRIDSLLGGGGQGSVYRATHVHLNRTSAFKVVRADAAEEPAAVERFRREARAVASLKHPLIVTVHDFGADPDLGVYLVMEFLEGRTLDREIARRGRLSADEVVEIGSRICEALHAAHSAGVLHRDVKPANVFLEARADGSRGVKLLDFGVAFLRAADAGGTGTPAYMAPEQWRGEQLDARSDVYATGCVLYEMLAGRPPFVVDGGAPLADRHESETPAPPSALAGTLPEGLDEVLLRALAKAPEERFQTAAELGEALEELSVPDYGKLETTAAGAPSRQRDGERRAPGNLPQQVTTFVGRERQMAEIADSLASSRLVTITGPGGSGKTRLALRIAEQLAPSLTGGAWQVQLAPLADPGLVTQAVATALGLSAPPGRSLAETLLDFLQAKRLLLLLDNCEHLVSACAELADGVLRSCPLVKVLATSQEPLGIFGEATHVLPPLSLPEESAGSPEPILRSEAVQLFVDRARLASPGFELTGENAAAVARICRRLDGIPLALELAAARVKLLSVEQIDARLDDRFRLLVSGSRTAEPRQRTLQAAIDWSYELLDDDVRTLFARLSVFAGGFTLEAAEAVCSGDGVESDDVLVLLSSLVDKSLVLVDEGPRAARYRMLQTIRQYAGERLRASGEAAAVRSRHRDVYHALAHEAEGELHGAEQSVWLDRLESEHDNLRAALEWSKTDADSGALLDLAGSLWEFWLVRGHAREGRRWLETALTTSAKASPRARAKALHGGGTLARVLGDYERSIGEHEESLALWREVGDASRIASALNHLGIVLQWKGDYERASALHSEALALAREVGNRWEEALALKNLGIIAHFLGDFDAARCRLEESASISRALDDTWEIASALNNLAVVASSQKDFPRSAMLLEEVLELNRRLGAKRGVAMAILNLGAVTQYQGDYDGAADLLKESLALNLEAGDKRLTAYVLECFVSLLVEQEYPDQALRIAGAAAALRKGIRSPLAPAEREELETWIAKAREALGEEDADRALASGEAMTLQQTIDFIFTVPTLAE